ncbi:MAG: energy transducer TonB [Candidatus Gastranaerophilales bacterium]|nr:energy transducer TonB [Candidatus Gastranaerophilales bacterium]
MFVTGKRQDQSDPSQNKDYKLPAVVINDSKEVPLGKALIISTVAHPAIVAFLWLLLKVFILLLTLLGLTFPLFEKPEPKVRDIEFVLVNKPEEKPLNPNTKYRSDRNSRAGGKNNPNIPVSEPEPFATKSKPQKATAPAAPKRPSVQKKQAMKQRSQAQQPTPVPPRPMPVQGMFKPAPKIPNAFTIPVPRSKSPKAITPGGPVTSGPIGYSSQGSEPSPVMGTGGSRGSSKARSSSGYSAGGGNAGNPGPGNPNGRPGIDAVREPDFGPYMRELQRRIKRNWEPPKGNESKRVVIIFKVSRDGRLLSLRVLKSSTVSEADKAAISAVELTAPFSPLPPEYKGKDIDIQFTFDYNVFSIGGRRY